MSEKFYDKNFEKDEEISRRLQRTDYLLIFLPMILSALLLIGVPVYWQVDGYLSGDPPAVGGFDFGGLVIFAGIILCLIFCVVYGLPAYILLVSTRRNLMFRSILAAVLLSAVIFFSIFLFRI